MKNNVEAFDAIAKVRANQLASAQLEMPQAGIPLISIPAPVEQDKNESDDRNPYPLDALPPIIQKAVIEVQEFVKAPLALVAASALSATSLACQGLASVERASGLVGPCGLFFITIADSGERKSTCDKFFIDPIRAWETGEARRLEAEIKAFKAQYACWKAEVEGLESLIKSDARKRKPTTDRKSVV